MLRFSSNLRVSGALTVAKQLWHRHGARYVLALTVAASLVHVSHVTHTSGMQVANLFYDVKGYFPVPTAAASAIAGIGLEQPSPSAAASPQAFAPDAQEAGGPSLASIIDSDLLPLVVDLTPAPEASALQPATALVPNPAASSYKPNPALGLAPGVLYSKLHTILTLLLRHFA